MKHIGVQKLLSEANNLLEVVNGKEHEAICSLVKSGAHYFSIGDSAKSLVHFKEAMRWLDELIAEISGN